MKTTSMKTTLTFHGGAGSVTGANFLLEREGVKFLVDCGMVQGRRFGEDMNRVPFGYDPATIDALFVTHAHIDHIGRIPRLVHEGFRGPIYATSETRELAAVMLVDSVGLLTKEAKREGKDPLYTEEDVSAAAPLWQDVQYHAPINVKGGWTVVFRDAGHILGSAMIELSQGSRKIVFTGDLGNSPAPLLRATEDVTDATYLVMESVYGDRVHEPREESMSRLEDAIEETGRRGGALLIPAFSIERTQVLLYYLNELVENHRIPPIPVYLDSPLAIKVTDIYRRATERFRTEVQQTILSGDDIFNFPRLERTLLPEESEAIAHKPNPKIIIAGSGMSNGGRIIRHEKRYLTDPNSTLLFVGYQAPGSLGRILEEGVKKVEIGGETIPVKARMLALRGFSAHPDREGLFNFAANTADTVERVFVAMGEPQSANFLAQRLRDYLGVNAIVPEGGSMYELDL